MIGELAKGTLELLVLRIIYDKPLHGYGILKAIRQRSGDLLEFREGALYPVLHRLEREGLAAGSWETSEAGRERKVYRLTEAGRARLQESIEAWNRFRTAVDGLLEVSEPSARGADQYEAGR